MRRLFVAIAMWQAILGAGLAHADPILTPIITAALTAGPLFGSAAGGASFFASIAPHHTVPAK